MGKPVKTLQDKFWARVSKTDGCWNWTGAIAVSGYGLFLIKPRSANKAKMIGAHRASYIINCGPILSSELVCHRCDNRRCVRPDHLFLGTYQDNSADMKQKGRSPYGINHPNAKLTDEQIHEISELRGSGITQREIAEKYGIAKLTVSLIQRGQYKRRGILVLPKKVLPKRESRRAKD